MSKIIEYDAHISRALQRMVGEVLSEVVENGLPGDHHFYIGFKTQHKGVDIPQFLKEQFPDEMTIVMQGWFDNLAVMEDRFFVTLSFSGIAQDLVIPFAAINSFSDPSVNFNLKFATSNHGEIEMEVEGGAEMEAKPKPSPKSADAKGDGQVIQFDRFKKPKV